MRPRHWRLRIQLRFGTRRGPIPIDQRTQPEHDDADPSVLRKAHQGSDRQGPARQDEYSGSYGMPRHPHEFFTRLFWFSSAEDEQGGTREAEEQDVDGHDVVENLLISPGHRDKSRP